MNLLGKIHEIGDLIQVTDTFKKRDIIIEFAENPTYPEYIKFEVHQDKTGILDNYKAGQEVELDFNLRGRPWTDKTGKVSYFNTLVLWKIKATDSQNSAPSPQYAPPEDLNIKPGEEDDLPF